MDRRLAESARKTQGIVALDAGWEEPDRARAARRLRGLEREGLVVPQGPNRWSVPSDLIDRLEGRAPAEPPRERLWIQKLPLALEATPGHRGPVWLDHVEAAPLASWGFGAEVRRALEQRRDALLSLGIAPDDPARDTKLRDLDREAVGAEVAARTGQQFLAKTPDRFRGRMQAGTEGARYAVVSDGARFVVVPASRDFRPPGGKSVTVARDDRGRLIIRGIDWDPDR